MISKYFAIFVVIVGIVIYKASNNILLKGLLTIYYKKITETINPYHPIRWLDNYDNKDDILNNLHYNKDHSERPNILLIVADDLGVNDIAGGCGIATPNIDSIARNGLNFTQAYSSQATCAPSRAALLTGRYPTNVGFEFTPIPKFFAKYMANERPENSPQPIYHDDLYDKLPVMHEVFLPKDIPTIAESLHELGYHNYFFGKWDSGFHEDTSPIRRGYDESLAFQLGAMLYADPHDPSIVSATNISTDNYLRNMLSYKINHNNGVNFRPNQYMTDFLGTEASHLIHQLADRKAERVARDVSNFRNTKDEPWFITLAFNAPHNPFQALKTDYERADIQKIPTFIGRIYASMILALDRNVGKVIDSLKETGQYNNTIIIFTSDNGAAPYVGLPHLNAPYRGWKATLFEGGIRIPFLVQWPQFITTINKKVHDMLIHVDIMPSLIAIASRGIDILSTTTQNSTATAIMQSKTIELVEHHDGIDIFHNIVSKYNHEKLTDDAAVLDAPDAVEEEMKTIAARHNPNNRVFFWRSGKYMALRYHHYKLQLDYNINRIWFFNLLIDPTEQVNLIEKMFIVDESMSAKTFKRAIASISDLEMFAKKHVDQSNGGSLQEGDDQAYFSDDSHQSLAERLYGTSSSLLHNLLVVYHKLVEVNARQKTAMWPAILELPICVDKAEVPEDICTLQDEYIIWAN